MSSKALRRIALTLLLATVPSLAPLQARDLGRRSSGSPARIEPARSFLGLLLRLFDFAKESADTGGAMDPNG